MKVKFKNIRVFEVVIDDEEKFFDHFEKNKILLKDYMLFLKGKVTEKIKSFLDGNDICYYDVEKCKLKNLLNKSNKEIKKSKESLKEVKLNDLNEEKVSFEKTLVFNRPIRSGEEIVTRGDIVIFGRVNSGSKIKADGNIQVFGDIDATIECDGDFMILRKIGFGNVIFNGEILDKELFKEGKKLKKITMKNGKIDIKDIS